ncbi:MAG TPA: YceI family protein [Solirubrobacteraceae bacterium]|nr:YceI family protein [Solirubrobacteraceae bacterium]
MSDRRSRLPGRPRTKRGVLLTIMGTAVIAVVAAVAIVYFVIFPTSSPKPFSLTTKSVTSSTTKSQAGAGSAAQIAGRWTIGSGSAAGYRVREKLAFLPAQSQAVGRTSSITGGATFTGSNGTARVTHASFDVNVETLTSDRSMRDEKIRSIGLESERYPTATFVLSSPIALPPSALTGQAVHVSATGALTIHGTFKTVTIPLEMSLSSAEVQTVGSITFPWSEFNMVAPSVGGFVNVTNSATMEFDLHLRRA